jgi:hypothetical protein
VSVQIAIAGAIPPDSKDYYYCCYCCCEVWYPCGYLESSAALLLLLLLPTPIWRAVGHNDLVCLQRRRWTSQILLPVAHHPSTNTNKTRTNTPIAKTTLKSVSKSNVPSLKAGFLIFYLSL